MYLDQLGTFPALRFYPVFLKLFPVLYRVPETILVFLIDYNPITPRLSRCDKFMLLSL